MSLTAETESLLIDEQCKLAALELLMIAYAGSPDNEAYSLFSEMFHNLRQSYCNSGLDTHQSYRLGRERA